MTMWTALPHEPLTQLADNVWWLRGSLPQMSLRRTMTLVRTTNGGLVVYNAIAADDATMAAIEALGKPELLVVPSGIHRLDAPRYKALYPNLRVLCPAAARVDVEKKVAVSDTIEAVGALDGVGDDATVRFETVPGVGGKEVCMWVRSGDGDTLVVNDVVFNMPVPTDFKGRLITGLLGSAGGPRVSRLARLALVKDRGALRQGLLRWADQPSLRRLVVAHDSVASGDDASAALKTAATFL